MKNKRYNRNTMSDMPMDSEMNVTVTTFLKDNKSKINVIGKKKSKPNNANKKIEDNEDWNDQFQDVKKQHEDAIRNYQTKIRRNRVAIIVLSILLVLSISLLSVYIYVVSLDINIRMIAHNADATYIIDGKELEKFRSPSNLQGNRILKLDIKIRIDQSGTYKLKFRPKCYQRGKLLENTLVYECNLLLFREGEDGYFYTKDNKVINGYEVVTLCGGIILDYQYENTLNVDNFRMEFHTYITRV